MVSFRTPRRRLTRQRSGFNVSGEKTGSTCKIEDTDLIHPKGNKIVIEINFGALKIPKLFNRNIGVFGGGAYLYASEVGTCIGQLSWLYNSKFFSIKNKQKTIAETWNRIGLIHEIDFASNHYMAKGIRYILEFESNSPVSLYGFFVSSLNHSYLKNNDLYEDYKKKTSLYIPELLYFDPTTIKTKFDVVAGRLESSDGKPIVCKSCNRCSRFLPVNIQNERHTLAYSNHCVSRAPCTHKSFSQYKITSKSIKSPAIFKKLISDGKIVSHFGHQLECKVCKKFFVNAPLNPLRNSTQHREDSLRRRALEVLTDTLLGNDWIYHKHRMKTGKEFDVFIWKKFGMRCFKCGKRLKKPNEMDLDHTLPLSFLWPLDDSATCLCKSCNSAKSDMFPIDFYSNAELKILSKITGLSLKHLSYRSVNKLVAERLFLKVQWFFDEFLANSDYQKNRKGKKAADLIVHSLHNVLKASGYKVDLVRLYREGTKRWPKTISISKSIS